MSRALVVAMMLAPLIASAEPVPSVPDRARVLAAQGRAAYVAGDYGAAVVAFNGALALAPTPALLFDLAQTYRLGGHCEIAAALYRRYLATNPDADARALADQQLASMERCIAVERAVAPVAPPAAVVSASASPARVTENAAPAEAPAPRGRGERMLGVGLGAVGGVALAASVYFAIEARDTASTVSNDYAHGATGSAVKSLDDRGRRDATLGKVVGASGLAAAGAGALLYYLGNRDARSDTLAVVPGAHGAEVHVQWRF